MHLRVAPTAWAPYLPAVDDFLVEDAKLVADAVTIGSQSQGGHGVQEAGYRSDVRGKTAVR